MVNSLFDKRCFRIRSQDLALFKFILEGYEGLATVTTIDRHKADIMISTSAEFTKDLEEIVKAVANEFSLEGFRRVGKDWQEP